MIHLVTALPAEARPLVRHFGLGGRQAGAPYPLYRNNAMMLVVSGPGKVNAAAACAWLQTVDSGHAHSAWLNIGIAGHASLATGTGVVAHRITDTATGKSWYPPQLPGQPVPGSCLRTVERPELRYRNDTLYDMEAAGFYPAACCCTTAELVQSFKVVSDNPAHPAAGITAKYCERLIGDQLATIATLTEILQSLQGKYAAWHAPHPDLDRLTQQWHFTVTQRHQLAALLKRWHALTQQPLMLDALYRQRQAAGVLRLLEQQINTMPVVLA